jgi:hypothetical protein
MDDKLSAYTSKLVDLSGNALREIWLIGSRANGTYGDSSDYDLVLIGSDELYTVLHAHPELSDPAFDVFAGPDVSTLVAPWSDKGMCDLEWVPTSNEAATYVGRTKWDHNRGSQRVRLHAHRVWRGAVRV